MMSLHPKTSEPPCKTAIVTGAGSGIGRATCLLLAAAGHNTVLVGRDRKKLDETSRLCARVATKGAQCAVAPTDLCDAKATRSLPAQAIQQFGMLDAIANVAGDAPYHPLEQITEETLQRVIDTNLSAIVHITAAAWPIFRKQGHGLIVNVSSMASVDPLPNFAAYAATKAAVNIYTRCTAQEGAPLGIQAVTVAPGAVETPMLRAIFNEKAMPRDKTLDPDDVARVVVDCVTGRRAFKPGEVILVPSP